MCVCVCVCERFVGGGHVKYEWGGQTLTRKQRGTQCVKLYRHAPTSTHQYTSIHTPIPPPPPRPPHTEIIIIVTHQHAMPSIHTPPLHQVHSSPLLAGTCGVYITTTQVVGGCEGQLREGAAYGIQVMLCFWWFDFDTVWVVECGSWV